MIEIVGGNCFRGGALWNRVSPHDTPTKRPQLFPALGSFLLVLWRWRDAGAGGNSAYFGGCRSLFHPVAPYPSATSYAPARTARGPEVNQRKSRHRRSADDGLKKFHSRAEPSATWLTNDLEFRKNTEFRQMPARANRPTQPKLPPNEKPRPMGVGRGSSRGYR